MSNDITFVRSEVTTATPGWTKVRDVVDGEDQVKSKGDLYLPRPNPTDESDANLARYDQYLFRASFFNATGRTLSGMIGIALGRWPQVELPSVLEGLSEDVDGAGTGLVNQLQGNLEDVLKTGRDGLLVDYPRTAGVSSVAEQKAQSLRPTITRYRAENIVNWRKDTRGRTVLVVLHEVAEEPDGYGVSAVDQWRELTLEEGPYTVRVWRKGEKGVPEIVEEFQPKDSAGNFWSEIPFVAVGAVDNNIDIDRAPLGDLANLNLAHYRNSADFEESTYFVGQPTYVFSGLDEAWVKETMGSVAYVGSRAAIPLPVGANAQMLQANENTLAGKAMERKEQQMIALGARLLTPGEAVKTAEQSRADTKAAHSVLSLACDNVSQGYTQALRWAARFAGADEESVSVSIETDFTGLMVDSNLVIAVVKAWQAGAIPKSDRNTALRTLGLIDPEKSDEDVEAEIEAEGGGLQLEDDLITQAA